MMSQIREERYQPQQPTLAGLPAELRLQIWELVFRSITVEIERGPERTEESLEECEPTADGVQISFRHSATRGISPLPDIPNDVLAIKSTCRTFAAEIGRKWHSMVEYVFPSTVAFVDILGQWPLAQVQSLRYARVFDAPFPIYPYDNSDCYHAFGFSDVLPMFPGLKLEILTVHNLWLDPDGSEVDSFCFPATLYSVDAVLFSKGWRTLCYVSGALPLIDAQQRRIDAKVSRYRASLNEPDFEYRFRNIRPQLQMTWSKEASDTDFTLEEAKDEIAKWQMNHPKETVPEELSGLGTANQVALWARRGANASYAEDGSRLDPKIQSLLSHMTWVEVRETDEYLVDDGLDDPTGHL